jgi:RNA polymerase sigma-70 factor (ECF subfamily)
LALVDKALRHNRPGPYQVQAAIAATHSRAASAGETDWANINHLYRALEQMQPSPVVTLNRAVAVSKLEGPAAALALIDPLEKIAFPAISIFSGRAAPFCCNWDVTKRRGQHLTGLFPWLIPPPKPPISAVTWTG